ncbi:MAG: dihydropteroate synthase DHPS [Coriobacteriaceae bacterium]|nr:dihydropteroate synthase DHPS [Coriobacteriaceae bacterium]
MLVIGEKVNVMSKKVGAAMKERDAGPVRDMAIRQVEGGADVLDVNLGPATKNGPETMEWVVGVVQEAVPDTRLCLDTMNPEAMEAGLKVCKLQPIINSTSAERARLETFLPLAKTYETEIIGLCMTEKGVSRDASERIESASVIMMALMEYDIPLDRLYLDPLLLPVSVAQQQAMEAAEAVAMFKHLNDPPLKSVVGLSNIYNGCPEHVKSPLAAALLALLIPAGLDAAIMDPNDDLQMGVARSAPGQLATNDVIEKSMTVLRNETLYCDSYLD